MCHRRFLRLKKTVDDAAEVLRCYDAFKEEHGVLYDFPFERVAKTLETGILLMDPQNCFAKVCALPLAHRRSVAHPWHRRGLTTAATHCRTGRSSFSHAPLR